MICDFFKWTQFFYNSVSIFTVVTFVYPAGMAACCPVKNISGAATMVPATIAPDVWFFLLKSISPSSGTFVLLFATQYNHSTFNLPFVPAIPDFFATSTFAYAFAPFDITMLSPTFISSDTSKAPNLLHLHSWHGFPFCSQWKLESQLSEQAFGHM